VRRLLLAPDCVYSMDLGTRGSLSRRMNSCSGCSGGFPVSLTAVESGKFGSEVGWYSMWPHQGYSAQERNMKPKRELEDWVPAASLD
jgi:hypothetical protein